MLASARVMQGAFGALLVPAALSLLSTTFDKPAERNEAFAIFGAIASSGASIGLILGGLLTQTLDWRYSMYINIVFAAVAVGGGWLLFNVDRAPRTGKIDTPSTMAVTAGLFALVFGFTHVETTTWTNPVTIISLAAGAALLALFSWLQTRVRHPLLPCA